MKSNRKSPGADYIITLALFLFGVLLGNVVTVLINFFFGQAASLEYSMLVSYPVMFLPVIFYIRHAEGKKKLDGWNFKAAGPVKVTVALSICTFALGIVSDSVNSLLPKMPEWLESLLKSMTTGTVWINFICVSVYAPLFEEWFCRGTIMRRLLEGGVKPVWAIVISAATFALIHANPWQAVPAFILGAMFGLVYWKTGSLKLTVLMHFLNNTFALVCSHIPGLDAMDTWKDLLGSYWGISLAAAVIITALTVQMLLKKEPQKQV